jgi:uncharacterized membrane protein
MPALPRAGLRVAGAVGAGAVVAAALSVVLPWQATVLCGWDVAALVFVLGVWLSVAGVSSDETRRIATREDPNRAVADATLVGASVGCLVGVGFALVKTTQSSGNGKAALVALIVFSVVVSWAVVHTVFALHYARLYYGDVEGGIDFNDGPPDYLDFAYLAFTVGMTYQVSDTALQTRAMRRAALGHALLSFLFGTFILAVTINVIAGLL